MNATTRRPGAREMERAFFARDASYDGVFVVGVRTTGIYCLPSCGARRPLAQNVRYFDSAHAASREGFRPCRRCRPDRAADARPEWIDSLLQRVDAEPSPRLSDDELRALGLAPVRVRRYFRERFGMTFQAYCRGRRMAAALHDIRAGGNLDHVVFDHGYESHSGFRAAFAKTFGTAPGRARASDCVVVDMIETPIGAMVAGATSSALCLLEFAERRALATQVERIRRALRTAVVPGRNDVVVRAATELAEYFAGTRTRFEVPTATPGTPFQESVWRALRAIPYGETRSYRDVARAVQHPGAVRAVGTANGANRIALVIPCHRVCRASGDLGGYGGGRWRKQWLLDFERARTRAISTW
jgi:AraC family transcriptional regulator of adaptative response/methylated-DNA-[protein]-cysteine methyltransferase